LNDKNTIINHQSTINNQQSIGNPSAINNHQSGGAVMLSNQQSTINNQQSLRVLLVEDNRTYREVFKDILRQHFQGISLVQLEVAHFGR